LLPTEFKLSDQAFRLKKTPEGYSIGGSYSCRSIKPTDAELEECWEGGILFAEADESCKRFREHVQRCFDRLMWKWIGRHVSRMNLDASRKITHVRC
jgi:hypothetical protein